jgi:hypothetical protein
MANGWPHRHGGLGMNKKYIARLSEEEGGTTAQFDSRRQSGSVQAAVDSQPSESKPDLRRGGFPANKPSRHWTRPSERQNAFVGEWSRKVWKRHRPAKNTSHHDSRFSMERVKSSTRRCLRTPRLPSGHVSNVPKPAKWHVRNVPHVVLRRILVVKRRAWDSNPQSVSRHLISSARMVQKHHPSMVQT